MEAARNKDQRSDKKLYNTRAVCLWLKVLTIAMIVTFMAPEKAKADRKRGCHGWILSLPTYVTYSDGREGFAEGAYDPYVDYYPSDEHIVVAIDGQGRCRIGQENKKCRRVAADAALKCASQIWASRWGREIPQAQCGAASNAKIREWAPGVSQFNQQILYGDTKRTIEYNACCRAAVDAKTVTTTVYYKSDSSHSISGVWPGEDRRAARTKNACRRYESFSGSYEVDCEALKANGALQCAGPLSRLVRDTGESRPKRTSPFQIKSAKIDFIKLPPPSSQKRCPRKVVIRTTFVTNKAGEVRFKLHRSHKPGEPLTFSARAKKIGGKWKAVHERVITLNKSANRSFMAETNTPNTRVRASVWEKLVVRCGNSLSPSKEIKGR